MHKFFALLFVLLLAAFPAFGAYLYVDQGDHESGVIWDDTDGHSYTSSAEGFPGEGTGYNTIQAAVDAVSVGDVIYMRGGTYSDKQFDDDKKYFTVSIPLAKVGTSWDPGEYYTLASYPGEWAILDGGNTGESSTGIVYETTNWNWNWNLAYWKFERFEVTGYRNGFWANGGPTIYQYLYIHDNRSGNTDIRGGIVSIAARYNTIEYCVFKDNYDADDPPNGNGGNIIFDSDQRDGEGDGSAFDPNSAVHHNIIRYCYLSNPGTVQNFRHKNQQRFGYNSRNPNDYTYKEYGDKIHHNIFVDSRVTVCQDFVQVYNNIVKDKYIDTREGDVPIVYNNCFYNNTVINSSHALLVSAGTTTEGTSRLNYYDDGSNKTVHGHTWVYNNISHGTSSTTPFIFYRDQPGDSATYSWSMEDTFVENNFIHSCTYTSNGAARYRVANDNVSGCAGRYHTTAGFNTCSATWRGVGSVTNWENTTEGLFLGESGADEYIASGTFVISGSTTIANGGIGGNHPYLSGATIPSYVGATNPSDYSWVAGVLALDVTYFTSATGGGDPSWIEGSGSTPTCQGISIQ